MFQPFSSNLPCTVTSFIAVDKMASNTTIMLTITA